MNLCFSYVRVSELFIFYVYYGTINPFFTILQSWLPRSMKFVFPEKFVFTRNERKGCEQRRSWSNKVRKGGENKKKQQESLITAAATFPRESRRLHIMVVA